MLPLERRVELWGWVVAVVVVMVVPLGVVFGCPESSAPQRPGRHAEEWFERPARVIRA